MRKQGWRGGLVGATHASPIGNQEWRRGRQEERVQWAAVPPILILIVILIERNGLTLRIGNQELNMDRQDRRDG